MNYLRYDYTILDYSTSQIVEVVKNCNGITITNTGADLVTVDGFPLYPGTPGTNNGDSLSIGGNAGELLDKKRLPISFATTVNPKVTIVQKYYK